MPESVKNSEIHHIPQATYSSGSAKLSEIEEPITNTISLSLSDVLPVLPNSNPECDRSSVLETNEHTPENQVKHTPSYGDRHSDCSSIYSEVALEDADPIHKLLHPDITEEIELSDRIGSVVNKEHCKMLVDCEDEVMGKKSDRNDASDIHQWENHTSYKIDTESASDTSSISIDIEQEYLNDGYSEDESIGNCSLNISDDVVSDSETSNLSEYDTDDISANKSGEYTPSFSAGDESVTFHKDSASLSSASDKEERSGMTKNGFSNTSTLCSKKSREIIRSLQKKRGKTTNIKPSKTNENINADNNKNCKIRSYSAKEMSTEKMNEAKESRGKSQINSKAHNYENKCKTKVHRKTCLTASHRTPSNRGYTTKNQNTMKDKNTKFSKLQNKPIVTEHCKKKSLFIMENKNVKHKKCIKSTSPKCQHNLNKPLYHLSQNNKQTNKENRVDFNKKVGDKFVSLVEDVVTQMSLLSDDNGDDPETKTGNSTNYNLKSKKKEMSKEKHSKPSKAPLKTSCSCKSKQLLLDQIYKWKNDYMSGLNMYIENQLQSFDRKHALRRNTLSCTKTQKNTEMIKPSTANKKIRKKHHLTSSSSESCHSSAKKPAKLRKLKSNWSRPNSATKEVKVPSRMLISKVKIPHVGNKDHQKQLKVKVKRALRKLKLSKDAIKVYAYRQVKLVSHANQLIIVGEGSTSISILGYHQPRKAFVIVKMFKLPFAGGKTKEIIDQSILSTHLNTVKVSPKFHGLVAMESDKSMAVGIHNVAMVFDFIGHTPSCAVTTLSQLCHKAGTSQMYRDPAAVTSNAHLNVLHIVQSVTEAISKVHGVNLVMPGLDACKVLIRQEGDITRTYLSGRLHPRTNSSLAWPTIAYLGLKNSKKSTSFSLTRRDSQVPPEAIRRGRYTIKSDVYELGKILLTVGQTYNISQLQYLARRCTRQDSQHRPELYRIMTELEKMIEELKKNMQPSEREIE